MKLDGVVNVVVLLVCLAVTGEVASNLYRRHTSARLIVAYKAGDVVKETPDLKLSRASRTLLLVTASTCHFCSDSMPFYRQIVNTLDGKPTRVIAVTTEDPANESSLP